MHDANRGSVYVPDTLYRITSELQEVDLSAVPAGTSILPESFSSANRFEMVFDGADNRTMTATVTSNVSVSTNYTMDPPQAVLNEITAIVSGPLSTQFTWLPHGYPRRGDYIQNPDTDDNYCATCDTGTNALISYTLTDGHHCLYGRYDKSGGVQGNYLAPAVETTYLWDGDQLIEEREQGKAPVRRGPGTDKLIGSTA